MSSLVRIHILSKKENTLEVEIEIIHPDEHPIRDDFSYAFQIILEQFTNIEDEYIYNAGWQHYPISQEEANSLITEELRAELNPLKEFCYGQSIDITEEEYKSVENQGDWNYKGEDITSMGIEDETRYHITLKPKYSDFCKEIEKYIESVEVLDHTNYPHWFDRLDAWLEYKETWDFPEEAYEIHKDEPNPIYTLKIAFKQPHIISHIIEGSQWESAAFSFEGYYAKDHIPKYTKNRKLLIESLEIKAEPLEQELTNWWNALSDTWKHILQINLHIQRHELFNSLVTRCLGMVTSAYFKNNYADVVFGSPTIHDLQEMTQMKALFASSVGLNTLEPIKMLKGLHLVELESNDFEDVTPLRELKNLQYLNLYSCYKMSRVNVALSNLKELKYLYVDPKTQEDINVITDLDKLRELHFFAEFEMDAKAFVNLKNLQKISGYSEGVTDDSMPILKEMLGREIDIKWELGETGEMLQPD
ncbi:hypothetical protein [Aquimarina sp. 2304DJ70-9]|uniref:hypothetical protein n=1 Tax=Aquimarina penaris TaxID=3231044 RepID=UPI00346185B8